MKRRSFLLGSGAAIGLAGTAAYGLSTSQIIKPQRLAKRSPLAFPPHIDARSSGEFSINAQRGITNFVPGAPSQTLGFSQSYLGPVVRVAANGTTAAKVSNELPFAVTSHWHGLIIPGDQDGGPHQLIDPGTTWSPELTINQDPAMTWFHSHVHGETATQVYAGLAGVMILDDGKDAERGLPEDYGVDDLVLVIQDKFLDGAGKLAYNSSMQSRMGGFIGNTLLVNGQVDAVASVPSSMVRLRLLNASNASFHVLEFSDGRDFYIVATDSGYLTKPVAVKRLRFSPGERVQVLVDFSDGNETVLLSSEETPMDASGFMGAIRRTTSALAGKTPVLAFQTDQSLSAKIRDIPNSLDGEVYTGGAQIAKT
ncbi:Blue copper oxidase CueO precursor, partial [hydrothermal vent metagenome]